MRCVICGCEFADRSHDHRVDNTGIDDGPYLPGRAPRKVAAPKAADELRDIREKAWTTRRRLHGERGHR